MLRVCKKRCLFYLLDLRIVSIIGVGNEFKILPRLMSRVRIPSPAPLKTHLSRWVFCCVCRFKLRRRLVFNGRDLSLSGLVSSSFFKTFTNCASVTCFAAVCLASLPCSQTGKTAPLSLKTINYFFCCNLSDCSCYFFSR